MLALLATQHCWTSIDPQANEYGDHRDVPKKRKKLLDAGGDDRPLPAPAKYKQAPVPTLRIPRLTGGSSLRSRHVAGAEVILTQEARQILTPLPLETMVAPQLSEAENALELMAMDGGDAAPTVADPTLAAPNLAISTKGWAEASIDATMKQLLRRLQVSVVGSYVSVVV